MWICHSRGLSNRIISSDECALRFVFQNKMPDFGSLVKNDSVTIHWKNLHYFITEIYKVKNNISPDVMNGIFHFQKNANYNLRSGTHLPSRNTRIILFGKETASTVEAKMGCLLPEELKNALFLQVLTK